jgi:hypothetical protein
MKPGDFERRLTALEGKRPDMQEQRYQERVTRFFKQCSDEELDRYESIQAAYEAGQAISPEDEAFHDDLLKTRGWFE